MWVDTTTRICEEHVICGMISVILSDAESRITRRLASFLNR